MLVGEDLGTVPGEVRTAMRRRGLLRSFVLQLELQPDADPFAEVPRDALAGTNTHDMPTFAGFWEGEDIERRLRIGLIGAADAERERELRSALRAALTRSLDRRGHAADTERDAYRAAMLELAASAAQLLVVNLEDMWGETEPQNLPGTSLEQPNWRRRARVWRRSARRCARIGGEPGRDRRGTREGRMSRSLDRTVVRHDVSLLSDQDLYLFNEGTHTTLGEHLGAHPMEAGGAAGTSFAVWAPGARAVSVVGDFNGWQPGSHPLAPRASSGIWEGFLPDVGAGTLYKYASSPTWARCDKADPFALYSEQPPRTASVVWELDHAWGDDDWMAAQGGAEPADAPDRSLRGAPRLVAAEARGRRPLADLPGAGRAAADLRHGRWGSPTSSSCP